MRELESIESEVCDWCLAYLAKTFNIPAARIDPHAKFARLGMDSAASVFLIVELEEWLGLELPSTIVSEYPTPAQLARYIAVRHSATIEAKGRVG